MLFVQTAKIKHYLTTYVLKHFFEAFDTRKSTTGVNGKRKGNFVFICDPCMTNRENSEAADTKSHVKSLESKNGKPRI